MRLVTILPYFCFLGSRLDLSSFLFWGMLLKLVISWGYRDLVSLLFFFVTVTLIGGRNPTVASYMSKGRFFLSRSLFLFNFFFLNHSLIMAQEYLLRLLTRTKGIIICC